MPGTVFKQTAACSFIQDSKEVKRSYEVETGRVEGFGWAVLGGSEGCNTLLSSPHRLNIDILEWRLSKKACCTAEGISANRSHHWLFPLDVLPSLECLNLEHFILNSIAHTYSVPFDSI